MKKSILSFVSVFIFAFSLQGCGVVLISGAIAGAGLFLYDQRPWETRTNDEKIKREAIAEINQNPELAGQSQIIVESFNGIVLLAGETTTPELREKAQSIVISIPNVRRVYNEIETEGNIRPASATFDDKWIATKVKSEMLITQSLKSSQFKIVVRKGTVYLLGLTDRKNGEVAAEVARRIPGVKRVVKLFEYE